MTKKSDFAPKLCKFIRIRTGLKNSGKSENYFHKIGSGHNKQDLVVKNPIFRK